MEELVRVHPETHKRYTRADLERAYRRIHPSNRQKQIHGVISRTEEDVTREAILFFSGHAPTFTPGKPGTLIVNANTEGAL